MSMDMLILILGVWGAGLSTYVAIRQARRERPPMHVAVRLCDRWLIAGEPYQTLAIEAVNTGLGAVHLESAALCLSDGGEIPADANAEAMPRLPGRLDWAEREEIYYAVATVLAELSRRPAGTTVVSACLRDADGHGFLAKIPEGVRHKLAKG